MVWCTEARQGSPSVYLLQVRQVVLGRLLVGGLNQQTASGKPDNLNDRPGSVPSLLDIVGQLEETPGSDGV